MSLDLSGLFNQNKTLASNQSVANTQITQTQTSQSQLAPTQDASTTNAVKMLQNMLAGDTFIGSVKNINNNNVLLQLTNGQMISARLTEQSDMQIGQNVTFLIESNQEDSISLKPLSLFQQENMLISKALDAANYDFSDANINIVKELLSNNMPLDAQTIGNMVKNSLKFPETSLNTIANLTKLDIPVTQDNIIQFEAYRNYEHSILNELNQLPQQINDTATQMMQNGTVPDGAKFMNQIVSMLYSDSVVSQDAGSEQSNQLQSVPMEQVLDPEQINQLKGMLQQAFAGGEEPAFLKNMDPSQTTVKDVLQNIMQALSNEQNNMADSDGSVKLMNDLSGKLMLNKEGVKSLLGSKELKALLGQAFDETMKLTPENVAKEDAISKYYKRVRDTMEHISNEIQKEMPDSKLLQNANNIKNNIDFMNELNKNMTFVQMPVKFSDSETNGELYVFTNKKALKNNSDQISALLHLDMEHLGPMDIYVKLAGKNVSTNFCLESEEMLDFIYEHIDELNQRLEALGYSSKFEMKVSENVEKGPDFVDDFINRDLNPTQTSQYLFDTKA